VDVYQFEGMVGRSPLMLEVFAKIRRIAPHYRTYWSLTDRSSKDWSPMAASA